MDRIAVGFNPNISGREAAEFAHFAEELGFESFWVHENPFIKDAISLLSNAISATKRIKVGAGCVSVVTRHPLLAATTFVALDEMSGGRVVMGVGLGGFPWLPKIGVKVFPVGETRPLKRIKEFLTITGGKTGERITGRNCARVNRRISEARDMLKSPDLCSWRAEFTTIVLVLSNHYEAT